METSGILVTSNKDGSMRVEYVDYGVSEFGGGEYQSMYDLDKENAKKLKAYLRSLGYRNVKEGLTALLGATFSDDGFCALCDRQGIRFDHFTWID